MKKIIFLIVAVALAGCSMEAQQIDKDWGKAQMASWDQVVANPQPQHVNSPPTGMEGIHAEGAMTVYNDGFWKGREKTDTFTLGVVEK